MIRAALICLYADEERVGEATNETLRSLPERLFIFFFAVLSEMAMWGFLLYTGVMFILTAESPVLIVRSTVAITFIQNIDETIYAACATDNIKSQVSGTKSVPLLTSSAPRHALDCVWPYLSALADTFACRCWG